MNRFSALYYQKPYIKEFEATVIACAQTASGYEIELSDTAFYPEGGGQPGDKGTLFVKEQPVQVSDTRYAGERIVHVTDTAIQAGETIHGVLDWENRCDNMHGHSGEHILTGILYQTYGYENIGFHMGTQCITIDFSGPLDESQVLALEQRANDIVRANLPVQESFPSEEERAHMHYRSKKELSGTVRIITIADLDSCACCGTHVSATGEIGLIKIINFTNRKKGVRLEVLCGRKALRAYQQEMRRVQAISRSLSVKPSEIQTAVEKLNTEKSIVYQQLHEMTKKYLKQKAVVSAQDSENTIHFEENLSIEYLRYFCTELLEAGTMHTYAVLSKITSEGSKAGDEETPPEGYNYVIVSNTVDLKERVKELNNLLKGRGGGSSTIMQGTFFAPKEMISKTLLVRLFKNVSS